MLDFHHKDPNPDFFCQCIEAGVKISFSSDSHNLYEIEDLFPHLDLLKSTGFDGDLSDILIHNPHRQAT